MRYRNSLGRRDIASLKAFYSDVQPMRTHWAQPLASALARSGADVFLVVAGFIIYHVTGRSAAQVAIASHAWASQKFARKRIGLLRCHLLKRTSARCRL
jgi:hypothetical protein